MRVKMLFFIVKNTNCHLVFGVLVERPLFVNVEIHPERPGEMCELATERGGSHSGGRELVTLTLLVSVSFVFPVLGDSGDSYQKIVVVANI